MVKAASKWLASQSAYPRSGRYPHREWPRRNSELLLQFSRHSFGVHFCEVPFDPEIARLRISRWLTVVDGGRMINMKTSRNQILGAIVMGIGMAMFEETIYDHRNGKPVNNNFADYMVAVNADIPELDCIFLDFPDTKLNE